MKTRRLQSCAVVSQIAIATILAVGFTTGVNAQIGYTTISSTYSQNFDSLPNTPQNVSLGASPVGWIDDTTSPGVNQFSISGWYLYHPTSQAEGGANGRQRMRIGAGTANTGAFMSFGGSGSTDRALGDVGSNTLAPVGGDIYIGLRLRNDTGFQLSEFTITFDGEQWRDGGDAVPNAQTMTFMWSTAATTISDPNSLFNVVPSLNFTSPVFANTGSGAAVDGNVAGLVPGITATITDLNWLPGTDLWLRWNDVNNVGNDHGLAIDNLTFSAIPEPSAAALAGMGALVILMLRRRK